MMSPYSKTNSRGEGMDLPGWAKTQRVFRTVFQVLTATLSVWAGFAVIAPQILDELAKILPGPWVVWLASVIAAITVVAGVLSRIMAIPAVNAWLTRVGLGTVPKREGGD